MITQIGRLDFLLIWGLISSLIPVRGPASVDPVEMNRTELSGLPDIPGIA
jgi:hypothetical protein